jgi:hypothetical protein
MIIGRLSVNPSGLSDRPVLRLCAALVCDDEVLWFFLIITPPFISG